MNAINFFRIGEKCCGDGFPPLFIAEEAQANQGDMEVALTMIDLAAKCGADGIEFQLFLASDLYVASHEGFRIYKERELSHEQIRELIRLTHEKGLLFHAACLAENILEVAVDFGADAIVVNATDLNNPRILDAVASCGKPFFLSTLIAALEEIEWAALRVAEKGADNFGILHGQHTMASHPGSGVPVESLNLNAISLLRKKFMVPIGFIDHSNSEFVPALAACCGASIITKHLSPAPGWKGPDWGVALEPSAWNRAASHLRLVPMARGNGKIPSVDEMPDRPIMRRSIVAARDIEKGQLLTNADIVFKRPGGGLDPRRIAAYMGRRTAVSIRKDAIILEEMLIQKGTGG